MYVMSFHAGHRNVKDRLVGFHILITRNSFHTIIIERSFIKPSIAAESSKITMVTVYRPAGLNAVLK
jgi:hypothetical protein